MTSIKVLAGDVAKGNLTLANRSGGKDISITDFKFVNIASEEKVKKASGTIGWGAVGGLALGPIGLAVGLLAGGNKKEVTFVGELYDGRKILAVADNKTYQKIMAVTFKNN